MQVYRSIDELDPAVFSAGSSVAIGKFDGLHLGHLSIIERVTDTARDGVSVIFTFAKNPMRLLAPDLCPHEIMGRDQRLEAFAAAGVEACVMVDFDAAFSRIPAERFVKDVLVERLHARHVVLGSDFRFGRGGEGDGALLQRMGDELGFTVDQVDFVSVPGVDRVSSSRLREVIMAGDIDAANRMLGREYSIRGVVVHGDARGRDLGFPTANLGETEGLVPADGVYAGRAVVNGAEHAAAISVGNNPTFTPDEQSRVEAYLLDFDEDIYGQPIEVQFVRHLRGMVAFTGMDPLIEQMHADVEDTRAALDL